MTNEEQVKVDGQMFTDLWKIFKKYNLKQENNDEFWEELHQESKQFYENYKTDLGKNLIFAITKEIEKRKG